MVTIILASIFLCSIQLFLYKKQPLPYLLFLVPITICACCAIVSFATIRSDGLAKSSDFSLGILILCKLIPFILSFIVSIYLLIRKFHYAYSYHHVTHEPLKILTFLFFILCAFFSFTIYFGQDYLIFYPNRSTMDEAYITQTKQFKKVAISTTTNGWVKEDATNENIILCFGGNAQNAASTFRNYALSGVFDIMEGYDFMIIDYPSYGTSSGKLSPTSLFQMADDTIAYIRNSYPDKQLHIVGYSIGSGVATYSAYTHKVEKLALLAPYDNGKNLYNRYLNVFHGPFQYLIKYELPSDQYAKQMDARVFIGMSALDDIVPSYMAKNLADAFNNTPELHAYDTLSHGDIILERKPWEDIIKFFNK